MAAVQQLCQYGILLNEGKIVSTGIIDDVIKEYTQNAEKITLTDLKERKDRKGSQWLKFTKVALFDSNGNEIKQVLNGQDVYFRLYYTSERELHEASVLISFNIRTSQGYLLTNINSFDSGQNLLDISKYGYFECFWPKFNLRSGIYICNLFCSVNEDITDWLQSAFIINVEDGDFYHTGKLISRDQGDILMTYRWSSHETLE